MTDQEGPMTDQEGTGSAGPDAPAGLPLGTIVPYAGDCGDPGVTGALARLGWLPCDGAILPIGQYPELYEVIQLNFGGEYDQGTPVRFNLPDLSGQFVRGVNLTAVNPEGRPVDPDVSGRVASHANGKAGNQVGSRQAPATGAPVTPFTAALDGRHWHPGGHISDRWQTLPQSGRMAITARDYILVDVSSDGAHTHQVQGGDAETRPVNVSLFFIIKASLGATA
jgi:hypothetical protein